MTRPTQPLRDEHRELYTHVDEILALADELADRPPEALLDRLARVASFLRHDLLRHAAAEEAALYPVVGQLMGAPEATATMSRDHREIEGLSGRLDRLVGQLGIGRAEPAGAQRIGAQRIDAQRILYGLHALVSLHFAKEEEVYLPLLDERLTPEDAAGLFANLEAAAHAAVSPGDLIPAM